MSKTLVICRKKSREVTFMRLDDCDEVATVNVPIIVANPNYRLHPTIPAEKVDWTALGYPNPKGPDFDMGRDGGNSGT